MLASEGNNNQLKQMFEACDLDGSGFIDERELGKICGDLCEDEVNDVFRELDHDGDGRITMQEFSNAFQNLQGTIQKKRQNRLKKELSVSVEARDAHKFARTLEDGLSALSCQEQVVDLYQQLHSSDEPHLLSSFEGLILGIIKDVQKGQLENERLEKSYTREREQHDRQIHQLEEEMEAQVQKIELQAQKKEKEMLESDLAGHKLQYEVKVSELESQVKNLQKLQEKMKSDKNDEQLTFFKRKVEDLTNETRHLKSTAMDSQTNLTLIKSETASLKHQVQEKQHDLESEREAAMEYMKENEHLTQQIHLLQNANQRVQDTNDNLRSEVENTRVAHRKLSCIVNAHQNLPSRSTPSPTAIDKVDRSMRPMSAASSLADEISQTESLAQHTDSISQCDPVYQRRFVQQESCEVDSLVDDIGTWLKNSGHSTLRDMNDSELEGCSIDEDLHNNMTRMRKINPVINSESESDREDHDGDYSASTPTGRRKSSRLNAFSRNRPGSAGSGSSIRSSQGSVKSNQSKSSSIRRHLPTLPSQEEFNGNSKPERMYKIVLAGDAAVGKSSFIMRLCKGKFISNLNSTLGVDFQTKTIKLDGRAIVLQLWDTAGQERFRSIAKSYFRKADGVLLLYDCTYERSYINVREWIDAIEDGALTQLPIMMCANKTDVRESAEANGKKIISQEEGQRLAKEYNSLFIETSAKDGSNINEAVTELARWLKTNEDLEVKSVAMGIQLHDSVLLGKSAKKKSCC